MDVIEKIDCVNLCDPLLLYGISEMKHFVGSAAVLTKKRMGRDSKEPPPVRAQADFSFGQRPAPENSIKEKRGQEYDH
jgi:hypothetical protein